MRGEPTDDGDLYSEPGEQLRLFQADEATADHHERRGQFRQFHRCGRREVINLLKPRDCRHVRLGAGGDEIRLRAHRSSIHEQGSRVCERCSAREDVKPVGSGDVGVLGLAEHPNQIILLLDERAEIDHPSRAGGA